MSDTNDIGEVRWASRVSPSLIRRLYETDAHGLTDEALIEDVGLALYARCRSILEATDAHGGRVHCPRCRRAGRTTILPHGWGTEERLACSECGWQALWPDYFRTYQDRHLHGGGATELFRAYLAQYDGSVSPRQKLLAIDRLIHTFHWELVKEPGRTAAKNLIYARNTPELLAFLDGLTYGDGSTPEMCATKREWDRKLAVSEQSQRSGYKAPHSAEGA